MAPPPLRASPDAPAPPTRKEVLGGIAMDQEHGKRSANDGEPKEQATISVDEVASSPGSDDGLDKRFVLERPPKFFAENDGTRGLANKNTHKNLPPPAAHGVTLNEAKPSSGPGLINTKVVDSRGFFKSTGQPANEESKVEKRSKHSSKKIGPLDHEEGLPGIEDDVQHRHDDECLVGVADQGVSQPIDTWTAETSHTGSENLRKSKHIKPHGGFFKEGTIGSIPMDDTPCHSDEYEKCKKNIGNTVVKRHNSKKIGSLDHEEGLPGVEDDVEHHHDDEGTIGIPNHGTVTEPVDLDEAAKTAPGAHMLHQDFPPDHSGGFFKEGTIGKLPMSDEECRRPGDPLCGAKDADTDHISGVTKRRDEAMEKRSKHSSKKIGPLDHKEGLPGVEDAVEHHYDDEGTVGIENQGFVSEFVDLDGAAKTAPGAHMLHQDYPPDHSGGFFKEGTIGKLPMSDEECRRSGDPLCGAKESDTDHISGVTKRREEGHAVHSKGFEITDDIWSSVVHGSVKWASENKLGKGAEHAASNSAVDTQPDDAETQAEAETLVKHYYNTHPEEKAEVFEALKQLFLENGAEGATPSEDQKAKRNFIHKAINEKGKGKYHNLLNVNENGDVVVRPEHCDGKLCEEYHVDKGEAVEPVPHKGVVHADGPVVEEAPAQNEEPQPEPQPEDHVDGDEWTKGLPDAKPGPPVDLDEAAAQAPGADMLHQDHAPDHSGGFFKEGTVGSIPMDDTPCDGAEQCDAPPESATEARQKRGDIVPANIPYKPCIIKSGVRSGNCGTPIKVKEVEKRGIHDWVNVKGKGKYHNEVNVEEHVPEEGLHSVKKGGTAEPVPQDEAAKQAAADAALLHTTTNGPHVEGSEWTKGIERPSRPAPDVPVEKRTNDLHKAINKSGKGKLHNAFNENEQGQVVPGEQVYEEHVAEEGLHAVQDGGYGQPVNQEEAARNWAKHEALLRSAVKPQDEALDIEQTEWTKGIDKHEENDGVPVEKRTNRLHKIINTKGKGKYHDLLNVNEKGDVVIRPEHCDGKLCEDYHVDRGDGTAPAAHKGLVHADGVVPAGAAAAEEAPAPSQQPQEDDQSSQELADSQESVEQTEWTKGIAKQNAGVPVEKRTNAIHKAINTKGKGKYHDFFNVNENGDVVVRPEHCDGKLCEEYHVDKGEAVEPVPHKGVVHAAGAVPAAPAVEAPAQSQETQKDDQSSQEIADSQSSVEQTEWTKGIEKHDENDGVPVENNGNPVPKHAKRLDLEDWRDDGEDALDVKFNPLDRLGAAEKGKHHKEHHTTEIHSLGHHTQILSDDHSMGHHTQTKSSLQSIPTKMPAPPRAPGHELPTARDGGFKYTKIAPTVGASATPTKAGAIDAYKSKPTHTAAVSGKTTAVPYMAYKDKPTPTGRKAAKQSKAAAEKAAFFAGNPNLEPIKHEPSNPNEGVVPFYDSRAEQRVRAGLGVKYENSIAIHESTYEPEKAATELNHGNAKGNQGHHYGKRAMNMRLLGYNTAPQREAGDRGVLRKYYIDPMVYMFSSIKEKIHGPKEEKPPSAEYMAMEEATREYEASRAEYKKMEEQTQKAEVEVAKNYEKAGLTAVSPLAKRRTALVKEEEDAKMRGYANSRHLTGAAARKERQKAADTINGIAKNLEEDRVAEFSAAENRAAKMMDKAKSKVHDHASKAKAKVGVQEADYLDHDTYDPTKAHAAEHLEGLLDADGPWTDVKDGELVDNTKPFATYQLGASENTNLPNALGGNSAADAGEMSDMSMVLVIGAWITVLVLILKFAKRRQEGHGQNGWLSGRRRSARQSDLDMLDELENGDREEKRYD